MNLQTSLQPHYDLTTPIAWAADLRIQQVYKWPCIVWTMWFMWT